MQPELFTVGHSTHPIDRFLALLSGAQIEVVADVRRYPGSRRHPQFGAAALEGALQADGVEYESFGEALGGRRSRGDAEDGGERVGGTLPDNSAWRSASFRAYADYMWTSAFAAGFERLQELARRRRTAIMCAEAHPSRCHRRLIADALLARGWRVVDILPNGRMAEHSFTPDAVVADGRVHYPAQPSLDL